MELRLDRDSIAGLVFKAAQCDPALAPALPVVRSLVLTQGFVPAMRMSAKVGPLTVSIALELSAVDDDAEIRIASISGNLFGVARKVAGDLIIRKLSALPGVRAERNRWGNISVMVDGMRFRSLGITGGMLMAELALE